MSHLEERLPEEEELDRKREELSVLQSELAQRELELATLAAELRAFEGRYLRIVGARMATLDEIEAEIAKLLAQQDPGSAQAREKAQSAQAHASESARAHMADRESGQPDTFRPSADLRRLYREVAKRIHPDLATDEDERQRRTQMMAAANAAYERADIDALKELLRSWQTSPEAVEGEGVGVELVRVIRKIAQVRRRLVEIDAEMRRLTSDALYELKAKVETAEASGRDLLAEMASELDGRIAEAKRRLRRLQSVGGAQ